MSVGNYAFSLKTVFVQRTMCGLYKREVRIFVGFGYARVPESCFVFCAIIKVPSLGLYPYYLLCGKVY